MKSLVSKNSLLLNSSSIISFLFWILILPRILKLIWPTSLPAFGVQLLDNNHSLKFYMIVAIFANIGTLGLLNLIMYFIYTWKIPFFQQFRISQKDWPWQEDPKKWQQMLIQSLFFNALNGIILTAFSTYVISLLQNLEKKYKYKVQDWPSDFQLISQFMFFLLYCELTVYWPHWLLHKYPLLYRIHKRHHQHHTSISLATIDAHPLEYIFSNILTTALGIPILSTFVPVHLVTMAIWISFRLTQAFDVHCGYQFPWGPLKFLPFKAKSQFHDFHHSHNVGCLGGFFTLTDSLMKTDKQYLKYVKSNQE